MEVLELQRTLARGPRSRLAAQFTVLELCIFANGAAMRAASSGIVQMFGMSGARAEVADDAVHVRFTGQGQIACGDVCLLDIVDFVMTKTKFRISLLLDRFACCRSFGGGGSGCNWRPASTELQEPPRMLNV